MHANFKVTVWIYYANNGPIKIDHFNCILVNSYLTPPPPVSRLSGVKSDKNERKTIEKYTLWLSQTNDRWCSNKGIFIKQITGSERTVYHVTSINVKNKNTLCVYPHVYEYIIYVTKKRTNIHMYYTYIWRVLFTPKHWHRSNYIKVFFLRGKTMVSKFWTEKETYFSRTSFSLVVHRSKIRISKKNG